MADETSMTPGGVEVRRVPHPQAAPIDNDPDTTEELRAHGIEISWSLTPNGWKHVVWDGERQVYASEFFDDAFQHAKTYASGKLGVTRDQVAIPASPGAASSGDRISLSGDTALSGVTASQGQAGALGVPMVPLPVGEPLRDNLVDGTPIHKRDASTTGLAETARLARNDDAPHRTEALGTPFAISGEPEEDEEDISLDDPFAPIVPVADADASLGPDEEPETPEEPEKPKGRGRH